MINESNEDSSAVQAVRQKILGGRAPRNAVLEEHSHSGSGSSIRYRFTLIPMPSDGDRTVELQAFSFTHEDRVLNVPRLVIRLTEGLGTGDIWRWTRGEPSVRWGLGTREKSEDGLMGDDVVSSLSYPYSLFPSPQSLLLKPQSLPYNTYKKTEAHIKALWEEGSYAKALAEIRRNERDSLFGPYYVPLRQALEKELNLPQAVDEPWQIPFKAALVLGLTILIPLILSKILAKLVTFPKQRCYKRIIFAGIALLTAILASGSVFINGRSARRQSDSAVLMKTEAYRVPDVNATANIQFAEGETVKIRYFRGDWVYVESNNGQNGVRTGWIPRESAVSY